MANEKQITYADAGVDTSEGGRAVEGIRAAVKSTYRPEVIGDIGGFGGLFSAAAFQEMEDPIMVSGTDGVGTKLELARRIGKYNTVGIDLVAMCANDILVTGAEPLFFLDYIAVGKLDSALVAEVVSGIAEGCKQAGCALIGGEMAEHPGTMEPSALDLSGFCVGVVDRPKMIDGSKVSEGDVVLGLASSGLHSNGYSLVRAVLEHAEPTVLGEAIFADESGDTSLDSPRVHHPLSCSSGCCGASREVSPALAGSLSDSETIALGSPSTADLPSSDLPTLSELLTPTRIYHKQISALLARDVPLKALAHITGGGITENLDRVLPDTLDALVTRGSWPVPNVIQLVVDYANLTEAEAYKTFNMGIGMAIIVAPEDVDAVCAALDEQVHCIGTITKGNGKVVYDV